MLKHTDLTRRRVERFLKDELTPRRLGQRFPLTVEFNTNPAADQKSAEQGPWKPVAAGFKYGPAYKVFWFRVSGAVPAALDGHETVLIVEVGGERTVWRNNSPWCGIDAEHSDFGWLEGRHVSHSGRAEAGAPILEYVQAYSRNPQTRVYGKEPAREELVEEVKEVAIAALDRDVSDLIYDLEFTLSLLGTLDESDPAYLTLLRAMNEVVNVYAPEARETLARGRKLLRDALGSLNGEFKHSLYAVGHAHLDTAWLWPLEITRLKMAHTTANQLRLLERYPEYHFVHSQASQYEWLENEYPGLFEEVKAAIARGQWEPVGSMWVEADCNLTGAEALVRQFLYGRRYFREKLGFETRDMWLPDVFGYSAALPQILAKFGIAYFLTQKISWNQFNKFPHHTFWWQGIDGTRVWTHFPPADTYNGSCEPKEVVYSVRNYKDHARADQSLYLFGHGDGGGGPTERHIELLRRGRLAPSYPEVLSGKSAKDFFREARLRSRDLMTWVGELYLELHRGTYTSQAANKHANRECEFLLRDAEWLASFAGELSSYPAAELEAAWKLVLLNQFHDIIPGSSVHEVYVDSAKDYDEVRRAGSAVIETALKALGGKVDSSAFARPIALFQNTVVQTEGSVAWDGPTPASLVVGDEVLPVQEVEFAGERKLIFATPTAAQGTVAVGGFSDQAAPSKYRLKASNRRIENGQFVVRFDPNGNLTSLESLEDGTEFIEPGRLANLFQLFEDKPLFWSAWDVDVFAYEKGIDLVKSESFEVVERGPVRVAAEVVKKFGNSTIRQRISLGPTPGVRFDTWVDWHEEDKLLKVAFPVNVNAARATFEIQFGNVERSTHMNTSWDMAKFEVCAQKWVDLSEGDQGVALLNEGKYGHDVRGNVLRMSLLRAPKAPDPVCDMGEHRFSYVLLPHFGPYNHAGVVPSAYALNAPLRWAWLEASEGPATSLPPFIGCDDRNLVIETVKRAEDGDGLIVRLYECHNSRGTAEVSCARPILGAELCDLEERRVEEIELTDGQLLIEYKPFEILTLRLRV
jgi:alpha-mannosidase